MGELGEALRKICDIERDMERRYNKEEMDPIMMDEKHTREIMERKGVMHIGRPYHYNINSKKREEIKREGLGSDEEEV
jgi:hypothetical protein